MDKVFNLEIDGQITLPDGSKLGPFYETSINIVQPSDADAAIENAKENGSIGYFEYYTDNSEEAYLSMDDKSINTKYLVLDLSNEDSTKLAWMRQELALIRLNQKNTPYMLKTYTISSISGISEVFLNKSMCDAYETSGINYYVNTGNYRFYVILDNSLLSQELQNTFPKNGVYFENVRAKGMGSLTGVQCSIRKYYNINPDYIPTTTALYVIASDNGGKVMAIKVASDGTITASEA